MPIDMVYGVKLGSIKPEWRTSTVLGICQSMRAGQDFSAMPILADALQDAGCGDEALLAALRSGDDWYARSATLVAFVLTDEAGAAVDFIEEFANDCAPRYCGYDGEFIGESSSYNEMIDAAVDYEGTGATLFTGADDHSNLPWAEFWKCFAVVTGRTPRTEDGFCRCAC